MRFGWWSAAAGFAIAGLVAAVALDTRAAEGQYAIGDAIEDFQAVDLSSGTEMNLASLKGKVVLVNFFAFKCGGCNAEAPRLEKEIWRAYKDRGLVVLGVTREEEGAKKFRDRHSLTYQIWVDKDGKLFDKFVDQYIPWNAIIDQSGKVRYTKVGFPIEEIRKLLDDLIRT